MEYLARTRTGLGLTLVAALTGACGDDGLTTATVSESGATTADAETGPGVSSQATTDGTVGVSGSTTVEDPTGGNSISDSQATTDATSTGQITATEPEMTSTTGVVDETTTTGVVDETTTTGVVDTTTTGVVDETSTGVVDETTGVVEETEGDACPLAVAHEPCDATSDDALHALGLNCTTLGGSYENNVNAVAVSNLSFQAPAGGVERAWQVAKTYGTYIDPQTNQPFWQAREGEKMLLISSGLMPKPNAQGVITIADGDVYNDTGFGQWDSDVMPPPMTAVNGSPDPMGFTNCDGINDCSNTLQAQWELGGEDPNDKMWFSFDVTAPSVAAGDSADANGYTFEFAYFSAEFPEYVDSIFNDIFVVWQNSEDYTGNVVFIKDQPLTVTALWPIDFESFDPHLQGTGYESDGGATGWYKAIGGVKPGETFTLAFSIFDMGDSSFDTTALLDNWLWDCEGCVPSEVDDCGITPQPM